MSGAFLAMGWGAAAGLMVALGVAIWVLHAVLALLRRQAPRLPPANDSAVTELTPTRAYNRP